jgi:beta-lactamase regulating signal transducer with metallopeptidase domain
MMALFLASAISDSTPVSFHSVLPGGILILADAAARALLVACVVGAGLRLLASRHVPAQKAAWGLVLAGALLMPVIAPFAGNANWLPSGATLVVPAHAWSQVIVSRVSALLPEKREAETPRAVSAPGTAAAIDSAPVASAPVERIAAPAPSDGLSFPAPSISNAPIAGTGAPVARPLSTMLYLPLSDLVWMIYGAVCLALLLRLAYGLGGAIGLWQSAEPVYLDSHLADGLHLRSSRKISSPVTVGSAVVLPADYDEWDIEKLRIVLAHERSHVRQGDFYLQALAGLYAAIFWFSPLGWWLKRKLSDLSEAISDHAGLEEAADHASYARILLEFAALPRRAEVGVAMAHTGRISQRIERLLNESSFRQAFAGGRSRLWAALALVPAVLFAAAALIRVEAAVTVQQPVTAQGPVVQTHLVPDASATPVVAAAPAHAPAPQAPPADAVEGQEPGTPAPATPGVAATPPPPPSDQDEDQDQSETTNAKCNARHAAVASNHSFTHMSNGHGYRYAYSSNGDSYALVSGSDKNHNTFSGDWLEGRRAEFDKARAMAKGDFLWFTRGDKSYVVDDPQTIASIQAMYKPMEDLGRRQEELGRKQEALGRQQEELGNRQEQASVPTPDVSKEMARLNAAVAKLEEKKNGTITVEQLADLQAEIGELQGKLGGLEGQVGARQGELGRQQGLLGAQQGRLGAEQGRLGAEQGRIAREADAKVKSIIDESLKNGKARPVQ